MKCIYTKRIIKTFASVYMLSELTIQRFFIVREIKIVNKNYNYSWVA